MRLLCRPVAEADIPAVCAMPQGEDELYFLFPAATFPLTPAQLQDAIDRRSDSTVVELDGQLAGFANFYRWQTGGKCSIGNVIVAPFARQSGVGRFLVAHMIDLAFTRHQATEVTISCFNKNVAGLLFYPKLGFEPYAIEERQDRKGKQVALIHMRYVRVAAAILALS